MLAFIEALGVTGAAKMLLDAEAGTELHVATYRRRTGNARHQDGVNRFAEAVRARRIPLTVIDERHRLDPALPLAVNRTLSTVRPDVVETHNTKSHVLVACAPARRALPWIAFHHGYTDVDAKDRAYNRLDRWALMLADLVVTPCEAFARSLTAVGVDRSRIEVLHNAVIPSALPDRREARRALRVQREHVIVSVGRLSREKGHDILIDACAAFDPGDRDRLEVLIAGEGPEREKLAARAAAAGVPVRLDGDQADVLPYYAAADLFALPSRSEGSPIALLEAMAAAAPIVAAAVGGIPEIVEHGVSAALVAPDRPMELRDAIAGLLAKPGFAAALGAGARRRAAGFSRDARHATLQEIYRRVMPVEALVGAVS